MLSRNKSFSEFQKKIEGFLDKAAGTNKSDIFDWLDDDAKIARRAFSELKKIQEVCTIHSPGSPQKLPSFFHPPVVNNKKNRRPININKILASESEGILLLGRLGQGKSMLLRYLHFLELNTGKTIPVFLELHKIKSGFLIKDQAIQQLSNFGMDCSKKLFDFLLKNGHISFFLDGYDEIEFEKRDEFNEGIQALLSSLGNKNVYITSRYENEIEQVAGLKHLTIEPLNDEQRTEFIKHIIKDKTKHTNIIKKLKEASNFDQEILDTPLLMTWFIMVFNVRRKIPKTKIGFYEELFKTILSRHDGNKGSLDRPSKSGLSDDDIEKILYTLCYITSKDESRSFTRNQITDYIREALNIENFTEIKAEDYLHDLTHITCLLVPDGINYGFIHDSVQKFFSASFIKATTESNSRKFYRNADPSRKEWEDELNFLQYIDSYRFNRFMIIPTISNFLNLKEENLIEIGSISSLSNDQISKLLKSSAIYFSKRLNGGITYNTTMYIPDTTYTFHYIFNDGHYNLCDTDIFLNKVILESTITTINTIETLKDITPFRDDTLNIGYRLIPFINNSDFRIYFYDKVRGFLINTINKKIKLSKSEINNQIKKEALF